MLLTIVDWLFWITLLLLIIGLIRPQVFTFLIPNVSRKLIGSIFGSLPVILFVIAMSIGFSSQKANNVQIPSPTSPQEQASSIDQFPALKDFVSGDNNDNQPKLRNFQYFPATGVMYLDINLDQAWGDPSSSVKIELSDVYIAVYGQKGIPNVTEMDVAGWMTVQDQYGNTKYEKVADTQMYNDVAGKINWNDDKADLELNIVPKNLTTGFAIRSLNF